MFWTNREPSLADRPRHELSPTAELHRRLLCVALTRLPDDAIAQGLIQEPIDWALFLQLVEIHRTGPLLGMHMSRLTALKIPDDILDAVAEIHRRTVATGLLQKAEIKRIALRLDAAGIRALLLKGLALEGWIHTEPGSRMSVDIDLLLPGADLGRAAGILASLGYELRAIPPAMRTSSRLARQYQCSHPDYTLVHKTRGTVVELHERLSRNRHAFAVDFETLWGRRTPIDAIDGELATLPRSLHAAYLCYHGAKHYWQKLYWLTDIARLMQDDTTDWPAIIEAARERHCEATVGLALALAHRLFEVPYPEVMNRYPPILEDGAQLADEIIDNLVSDQPVAVDYDSFTGLKNHLDWNCRLNTTPGYRLSEWLFLLFVPRENDWNSLALPDLLTPLYRVWRPLRLLLRWLQAH